MYLLASYPRSGNTWVRYIIEEITALPTEGYRQQDLYKKKQKNPRKKPHVGSICKKTHLLPNEPNHFLNPMFQGAILLLRNPFYVLTRHLAPKSPESKDYDYYMSLISAYDKYAEPKLIISYENLISDPEEQIHRLIEFVLDKPNTDALNAFLENIDDHKNKCLNFYNGSYGTSQTHDTGFISTNLEEIEEQQASFSPFLIEKYGSLTHYLEEYL